MEETLLIQNLEAFETAFNKLVRKAAKLGCPIPTWELIGESEKNQKNILIDIGGSETEFTDRVKVYEILVKGEAPNFEGWSFGGISEDLERKRLWFGPIDNTEIPVKYKLSMYNRCEHCDKKRRRNKYYLVQHENGELKQVGSTCIKDFLGNETPQNVARQFEFFNELITAIDTCGDGEWNEGGNYRNPLYSIDEILIAGMIALKWSGGKYLKSDGYGESTSYTTKTILLSFQCQRGENYERAVKDAKILRDVSSTISEIKEMVNSWPEDIDYFYKVKAYFEEDRVSEKGIGLIVSTLSQLEKYRFQKSEVVPTEKLQAGKQLIKGEIKSFKSVCNPFNDEDVTKITLIMDNGNRVYGTLPRKLDTDELQKGSRIQFHATITPKEDHFGFYSRPTKPELVSV